MSDIRVAIVAEDGTELEVEVDGAGVVRQVFRVRDDGSLKRSYRRLTELELEEVGELAGFTSEQPDE